MKQELILCKHPDTGEIIQEEWRSVPGFQDKYQISNYGRVKTIQHESYTIHYKTRKRIPTIRKEVMRRLGSNPGGYSIVSLCDDGKTKHYSVHRLVANAFIPNPKNLPQINHKNTNKKDNRFFNLEWCTAFENKVHALNMGLIKVKNTAMNADKVRAIRADAKSMSARELSDKYKSNPGTIGDIVKYKTWKNV